MARGNLLLPSHYGVLKLLGDDGNYVDLLDAYADCNIDETMGSPWEVGLMNGPMTYSGGRVEPMIRLTLLPDMSVLKNINMPKHWENSFPTANQANWSNSKHLSALVSATDINHPTYGVPQDDGVRYFVRARGKRGRTGVSISGSEYLVDKGFVMIESKTETQNRVVVTLKLAPPGYFQRDVVETV